MCFFGGIVIPVVTLFYHNQFLSLNDPILWIEVSVCAVYTQCTFIKWGLRCIKWPEGKRVNLELVVECQQHLMDVVQFESKAVHLMENDTGLLLEQCVSTEQEDWAAQVEENHWSSHLLMMSHSCLPVLYLYMTMSCPCSLYS